MISAIRHNFFQQRQQPTKVTNVISKIKTSNNPNDCIESYLAKKQGRETEKLIKLLSNILKKEESDLNIGHKENYKKAIKFIHKCLNEREINISVPIASLPIQNLEKGIIEPIIKNWISENNTPCEIEKKLVKLTKEILVNNNIDQVKKNELTTKITNQLIFLSDFKFTDNQAEDYIKDLTIIFNNLKKKIIKKNKEIIKNRNDIEKHNELNELQTKKEHLIKNINEQREELNKLTKWKNSPLSL